MMDILDVKGMLAQSCDAMAAGVVKSTNEHDTAAMGFFDREQLWKRMII